MYEKYTEANCSSDIECEIVRIFDMAAKTDISNSGRISH